MDNVLKALEAGNDDPDQRWMAGQTARFLRALIELGPDEKAVQAGMATRLEERIVWSYTGAHPLTTLNYIAGRLEEIGGAVVCKTCGGSGQTQSIRHPEELMDCPSCNTPMKEGE